MATFLQDARFALRTLIRRPGFTLVAVLSLGLGIGASATVFSMINAFLLRPMPYERPGELLHVWSATTLGPSRVSVPDFLDWRAQSRSFADMAAFNYTIETLTGGELPEQVSGARITANAFRLLGVEPLLGRALLDGEDRVGAEPVVLISERMWRERYAADSDVLGRSLEVQGEAHTIVGVVGDGFNFPLPTTRIWLRRTIDDPAYGRGRRLLQVAARLAPGVPAERAAAEMAEIAARLESRYPEDNEGYGVVVEPLQAALNFAYDILTASSALMAGAAIFVLLIACANVSSLLLSRTASRERELAVRAALGAGRRRLARQLLTESVVVAVGGALAGLAAALWGTRALDAALPAQLYRVGRIEVDGAALALTVVLCGATALLFGSLPALRASRGDLVESLKRGAPGGGAGRRSLRLQGTMVAVEMTLAIVLLVGTALMLRTLANLQAVDAGFRRDGVLTIRLPLPQGRYAGAGEVAELHESLIRAARALPGAVGAATVNYLPLNHEIDVRELVRPDRGGPAEPLRVTAFTVSAGYFGVMGIPLMAGRDFAAGDGADSPEVVIVDATTAARLWPDEDPIGSQVAVGESGAMAQVIGVVGPSKQVDLTLGDDPVVYLSAMQSPQRYFRLLVRTEGDPGAMAAPARAAIARVDSTLPINEVRTLEAVVTEFLLPQNIMTASLALLAAGAILLAAVGVYGLMSFFVAERTREFGIHAALGATRARVRRMIVAQVLRIAAVGVGIGLLAAWAAGRLMASMLYGVGAADPPAYLGATLFLVAVAVAAGLGGARRVTRADPMTALRAE